MHEQFGGGRGGGAGLLKSRGSFFRASWLMALFARGEGRGRAPGRRFLQGGRRRRRARRDAITPPCVCGSNSRHNLSGDGGAQSYGTLHHVPPSLVRLYFTRSFCTSVLCLRRFSTATVYRTVGKASVAAAFISKARVSRAGSITDEFYHLLPPPLPPFVAADTEIPNEAVGFTTTGCV